MAVVVGGGELERAHHFRGELMGRVSDRLMFRPQQRSSRATTPPPSITAQHYPDNADLDTPADRTRMHRIITLACECRDPTKRTCVRHDTSGIGDGNGRIARRSSSIRSIGRARNVLCTRTLARSVIHSCIWPLKSAGDTNARPGKNDVVR